MENRSACRIEIEYSIHDGYVYDAISERQMFSISLGENYVPYAARKDSATGPFEHGSAEVNANNSAGFAHAVCNKK